VLVVDDSLSVRKVVQHMLARSGVKLTLAVDGADALAKLRESHHDIVFTDLEMPRMNGYELIREMRYVPQFRGVPVVVISSRSAEKHRKQAADLGADAYLAKPFTEDDLQSMLRQFTRWRQGRSAARSRR
jgi:chemosensory pili system protein ChpA (sensor histidine kinase/response regulator)